MTQKTIIYRCLKKHGVSVKQAYSIAVELIELLGNPTKPAAPK